MSLQIFHSDDDETGKGEEIEPEEDPYSEIEKVRNTIMKTVNEEHDQYGKIGSKDLCHDDFRTAPVMLNLERSTVIVHASKLNDKDHGCGMKRLKNDHMNIPLKSCMELLNEKK